MKTDNSNFLSLLKKELYLYFIHPYYFFAAVFFNVFCSAGFFIAGRFFSSGAGNAGLTHFFSLMPYAGTIILPTFCLNCKNRFLDATLPYSSLHLVLARLCAAIIEFSLFLIPSVLVPVSVSLFGDVDSGSIFISYLGILCFSASCLSLCIFLYEITYNRAAYFVLSFIVLGTINIIHMLPTVLNMADFITGAIHEVSFAWRFDSAGKGILDTRDFSFYAATVYLFVLLTVFIMEKKKGQKYFQGKLKFRTVAFILTAVFLYLDGSSIYTRIDFSKNRQYSISGYSKKILSGAEDRIRITYYRTSELAKYYPSVKDIYDFLKSYSNENRNITLSLVDPQKMHLEQKLKELGIQGYQIQNGNAGKMEYITVYSAIVIEYLEKTEIIPFIVSPYSLEYDMAIRFDYLLNGTTRKAYILAGNGLELESGYKSAMQWLNLEGIQTVPLYSGNIAAVADSGTFIEKSERNRIADGNIPNASKAPLIVFGSEKLSLQDAFDIEEMMLSGTPCFIATSPYTADINGNWGIKETVGDPLLPAMADWGAAFQLALAADISNVRASFYSAATDDGQNPEYEYVNYPLWISVLPQENTATGVNLFWPSPVECRKNAVPLFHSSDYSWIFLPDYQNQDSIFFTDPFTIPKAMPESSLAKKQKSVLGCRIKGRVEGYYSEKTVENAAITVIPDQFFANDLMMALSGGEQGDYRNLSFLSTEVLRLMGLDELADLKNSGTAGFQMYKITDEEKFLSTQLQVLALNLVFVPLSIMLLLVLTVLMRKKANEQ